MIEVKNTDPQVWLVAVPVEDGEVQIKIQPEGLVIDFVYIDGQVMEHSSRTWQEVTDEACAEWLDPVLERARGVMARAKADLGDDLGGYSPVDLLMDQMPEIRSPEHARSLLADLEA